MFKSDCKMVNKNNLSGGLEYNFDCVRVIYALCACITKRKYTVEYFNSKSKQNLCFTQLKIFLECKRFDYNA